MVNPLPKYRLNREKDINLEKEKKSNRIHLAGHRHSSGHRTRHFSYLYLSERTMTQLLVPPFVECMALILYRVSCCAENNNLCRRLPLQNGRYPPRASGRLRIPKYRDDNLRGMKIKQ